MKKKAEPRETLYRVEFAIDVSATSAKNACRRAWELMTKPESMLPIGTVTNRKGKKENVDLNEVGMV